MSLHIPQKQGPFGNRRPFPEPYLAYRLESPVKEPSLQVPLIELLQREISISKGILPLSLRVPSKRTPFPHHVPSTVSVWREMLRLQSHWFIDSFISVRIPKKRALPQNGEGGGQSPSTEPHVDGRPTYIGVRPGSPRGSLMTLLSLPPVPCSP